MREGQGGRDKLFRGGQHAAHLSLGGETDLVTYHFRARDKCN